MGFYVKTVRKYVAAFVAALLLGSTVQANVANAGMKFAPDIPLLGLLIEEGLEFGRSPNVVFGIGNLDSQETWLRCDDIEDKICTDAAGIIGYVNLTVCTDASNVACIADVWAVDPTGKKIPGKLVKSVPKDYGKFTCGKSLAPSIAQVKILTLFHLNSCSRNQIRNQVSQLALERFS